MSLRSVQPLPSVQSPEQPVPEQPLPEQRMLRQSVMSPSGSHRARAQFRSNRIANFTESVIREMTRLAIQFDAVNLAQGHPDFPAPDILKEAAREAISADFNQYSITWGAKPLRDAIAAKYQRSYGVDLD